MQYKDELLPAAGKDRRAKGLDACQQRLDVVVAFGSLSVEAHHLLIRKASSWGSSLHYIQEQREMMDFRPMRSIGLLHSDRTQQQRQKREPLVVAVRRPSPFPLSACRGGIATLVMIADSSSFFVISSTRSS